MGIPSSSQDINQQKNYEQTTKSLSTSLLYTEPLTKELSLQLGYQFSYNNGINNQITKEYTNSTGKYDDQVDSLSNEFKQNIFQNIPSVKINFANKKLKLNAGSSFGFTQFDLQDITYNKDYKRNYTNFYPTVNGTYTYKPNRSIRFNYSGSTTQPTVNQLQPLRNNTDYFNQVIGNPDLQPSFSNSFNVSHQNYNFLKDIWMYQSVNVRFVQNAITTNSIINLDSGYVTKDSKPLNLSNSQCLLLKALAGSNGETMTYRQLLESIDCSKDEGKEYTRQLLRNLKEKLDDNVKDRKSLIQNVKGIGYRLNVELGQKSGNSDAGRRT